MNDLIRNIASVGFVLALCGMALAVRSARRNMKRHKERNMKRHMEIRYEPIDEGFPICDLTK